MTQKQNEEQLPPGIVKGKAYSAEFRHIDGPHVYHINFGQYNGQFVISASHYHYGKMKDIYSRSVVASTIPFAQTIRQRFNLAKTEQPWLTIFEGIVIL